MDWQLLVAVLLGAFALSGIICLGFVFTYWNSVGGSIPEVWPKVAVESIQLASASVSIGAAFATASDEKYLWLPAAIAGAISLAVWKLLQVLIDFRVKAWEKEATESRKRVQEESENRTRLLTLFREFVVKKIQRLSKALKADPAGGKKPKLRAALTPDAHMDEILLSIAIYFSGKLPEELLATRNFRVGLYVDDNGHMKPRRSVDSNHGDYDSLRSFESHKEQFSLGAENQKPAHVVKCIQQHRTIIVEDCAKAAERGEFFFFTDNQKSYLRSLLTYDAGQVYLDNGKMTSAAIANDTDSPGFFREEDRESLEFALREFASRLKLELLLHAHLHDGRRQS